MIVGKLCLWIEGQPSPLFINYQDLPQMQVEATKVRDRTGWIKFGIGDNRDKVSYEDYIWAGSVVRYRMEVFS